jgi:hypothetical protein
MKKLRVISLMLVALVTVSGTLALKAQERSSLFCTAMVSGICTGSYTGQVGGGTTTYYYTNKIVGVACTNAQHQCTITTYLNSTED